MDKVTAIKIKYADNTYSEKIPFTVLAENVEWNENKTLVDILGTVDLDKNIQNQIDQLYNNKISLTQLNNYVNNQLNNKVTSWLDQNVNPVGSAIIVDKSLSIDGAAADAKKVGNIIDVSNFNNLFTYTDYGGSFTQTKNNLTYDKNGPMIIINGARTNTTTIGTGLTNNTLVNISNNTTSNEFTNPNLKLKANKKYLIKIKFLSGTITNTGPSSRKHEFKLVKYDGINETSTDMIKQFQLATQQTLDVSTINQESIQIEPTVDMQCGLVFVCRGLIEINNLKIFFNIQEINPLIDSSLSISGAAADAKVVGDTINAININKPFTYNDYGGSLTETKYGLTYDKSGQIVIINGANTNTTTISTVLTNNPLISQPNAIIDSTYTNPNLKLKIGKKYLIKIYFLSGTITNTGLSNRKHEFKLVKYDGENISTTIIKQFSLEASQTLDVSNINNTSIFIEPINDIQCGLIFEHKGLIEINNLKILFNIEDVTDYELNSFTVGSNVINNNQEAIKRIKASNWWWGEKEQRPDMLNFLHFSDIHGWKNELERIIQMKQYLKTQDLLTDVICTGDLVKASYGGGDYESVWCSTTGTSDILFTIGNHDTYQSGSQPHGKLTISEKYSIYFDGKSSQWGITINQNTSYYFKDYPNANIRLIAVDPGVLDSESDQKTWLENKLSEAKTLGYAVIIASHFLRLNNETEIKSVTILDNAWSNSKARATVTDTPGYDWAGTDIVKCVTDFISDGGQFICYLIGHTHSDILSYPTGHPDQLIITITTAAVGEATGANRTKTGGDLPRQTGTQTEDCFNVITIDPITKYLKCVRVGADINMLQIPRKAFVWDYNNKQLISVL